MFIRIQPEGMVNSSAFSQAIEVTNTTSTLYIAGQNSVNEQGKIIGEGDFVTQCLVALKNLHKVLETADYKVDHVVKWTIYMVMGNDPRDGFKAFQEVFGDMKIPPVITVLQVAGLARSDILIEIEAIAVK